MARFFKPLLSAVALAAALTSTGALAAYAYNAQISVAAPKGSTAEAAAKNKSLPTGVKYSTCAPASGTATNPDFLQITVKYDAGKLAAELADVYVLLQNLNVDDAGLQITPRYLAIGRNTAAAFGSTSISILAVDKLADLDAAKPFVAKGDNLGTGAQTEVLLGGSINVTSLPKGLWAASVIIANPGASGVKAAATDGETDYVSSTNGFLFGRQETWAAHDTTVFQLGSPVAVDMTAKLNDVDSDGASPPVITSIASDTCE